MAFDFLAGDRDWFWASTGSAAVGSPTLVGRGSAQLGPNGSLSGPPGLANGAPSNLFLGVLRQNSGFIGFLQALRDENVAKLLAEPRLVTMSGRPASFLSGGEQAVPIPAGLGQVGVQFEEFGTRLNFLPVVLGNGRIHLEVEPEVSQLDAANGTNIQGTVVPGRVTQRVHTTVELEDGQTFVLGGLIQREEFRHYPEGAGPRRPALPRDGFPLDRPRRARRGWWSWSPCIWSIRSTAASCRSTCPARKPAARMILSYSWKESSKLRGPRSLCGGENHYRRRTRIAPAGSTRVPTAYGYGGCGNGSCPAGGAAITVAPNGGVIERPGQPGAR
jgi:hypothetical protein